VGVRAAGLVGVDCARDVAGPHMIPFDGSCGTCYYTDRSVRAANNIVNHAPIGADPPVGALFYYKGKRAYGKRGSL